MLAVTGFVIASLQMCEMVASASNLDRCVRVSTEAIVDGSIYLRALLPVSLLEKEQELRASSHSMMQLVDNIVSKNVELSADARCASVRDGMIRSLCTKEKLFASYAVPRVRNVTFVDAGIEYELMGAHKRAIVPRASKTEARRIETLRRHETLVVVDGTLVFPDEANVADGAAWQYVCDAAFVKCYNNEYVSSSRD